MKLSPGTPLRISMLNDTIAPPMFVGLLAAANGVAQLEWSPDVIQEAIRIDPGIYRPEPGLLPAQSRMFDGLHGFLADSLPDAWGQLVMRLRLRKLGFRLEDLSGVDRLALLGTNGRGALIFEPATTPATGIGSIDLDELAAQSQSILLGHEIEQIDALATLGGGSGGARPKVHLGIAKDGSYVATDASPADEHEAWIVKFRAATDPIDIGPVEEAYARMARVARICVPETKLLPASTGPGYFATKRFDRPAPGKRIHMVSLSGALEAPWQDAGNIDYDIFLRATARFTRHAVDVEEAFRRMVFNVLTHNRDDHGRQHSYLMDQAGEWRLAPAYDLTYSSGPGGEHYLAVQGEGRNITRDHVLGLGQIHGLSPRVMTAIIDQAQTATNDWAQIAKTVSVGPSLKIIGERLAIVARTFG